MEPWVFVFWCGVGALLGGALGYRRGNVLAGVLCGVLGGPLFGPPLVLLMTPRRGEHRAGLLPDDVRDRLSR